jgi:hypothetical protein
VRWGRLERRRARRSEAVEQAIGALGNMRGRFGHRRTRRRGKAYGGAAGLGIGTLGIVILISLLLLRRLRRTERQSEATDEGRVARLKGAAARRLLARERQRADAAEREAEQLRDELEEERKPWWRRFFDKVTEMRQRVAGRRAR